MVRCIDCGVCGFYVDLLRGLRWYEMDRATRQAFRQNQEHNPPGQNPGTGHWNFTRCAKYLQEWAKWNGGAASQETVRETLVKERVCSGYADYKAGLTPQEHPLFRQLGVSLTSGKEKVVSHDQQGGITAFSVNVGVNDAQHTRRSIIRDLPLWVKWLVAVFTIAGVLASLIFGLLQALEG